MSKLNHIALLVPNYDSFRTLFEDLGMTVKRETGNKPSRQLWFHEGLQLIEKEGIHDVSIDHIALDCEDYLGTISLMCERGGFTISREGNWVGFDRILFELLPH